MAHNQTSFNSPNQTNTAILFLVFNRLDTTKQVFEAIRQAKPPCLYIAADGARVTKAGEAEIVQAVRDYVVSHIDWVCEVKTLFRNENLGCKYAVSSAITWFFENEEMGIILEDDCLPDPTFFRFCEELLERYRDDQRIGMISGDNFQFGHTLNDDSYYFSNINHIWGWASWRSRWQQDYDVELKNWPKVYAEGRVADWFGSKAEQNNFISTIGKIYQDEINTWDYQWLFASRLNGRISVMPNVNLISNIGFGINATHTTGLSEVSNLPVKEIQFPLKHPISIFASITLDNLYHQRVTSPTFKQRLKFKIKNIINNLVS